MRSTVLWRIERSRDVLQEAMKNMLKNSLEAMVGAVDKVINGVRDGMAKEWKEKKQEINKKRERMLTERRGMEDRER
jgi:hypothetical protein